MPDDRLITLTELLVLLPVSRAPVDRRVRDKSLPSVLFGSRRLFPLAKVRIALGLVEIAQ